MRKILKDKIDGIYQYPSTILTERSSEVEFPINKTSEVLKAIDRMLEWEQCHPKSQGLSAVQVGTLSRVAVIKIDGELTVMINPQLTCKFGKQKSNEGCHSLNEARFILNRSRCGMVKYNDVDGNSHHKWLSKKYIRLIQHELDHMDGILISMKGVPYENTSSGSSSKN